MERDADVQDPAPPAPLQAPARPRGRRWRILRAAHGPQIIACISTKYASKRAPVGSLSQRQDTWCSCAIDHRSGQVRRTGLRLEPQAGGPELSIDVIVWKRPDGNMGVDIGFDYDNIGTELKLVWGEVDLFASHAPTRARSLRRCLRELNSRVRRIGRQPPVLLTIYSPRNVRPSETPPRPCPPADSRPRHRLSIAIHRPAHGGSASLARDHQRDIARNFYERSMNIFHPR